MSRIGVIENSMPRDGSCTPSVPGQQAQHALIGKVISIRQKLDDDKRSVAADMHKLAAPVAAAVLDASGKDDSTAEFLKQSKQEISDKRNGVRGMALWELVALLAAEPEAFLAFSRLFCEVHGFEIPQPKTELTREELADIALVIMSSGPLMTILVNEVKARRGMNEQDVAVALTATK